MRSFSFFFYLATFFTVTGLSLTPEAEAQLTTKIEQLEMTLQNKTKPELVMTAISFFDTLAKVQGDAQNGARKLLSADEAADSFETLINEATVTGVALSTVKK